MELKVSNAYMHELLQDIQDLQLHFLGKPYTFWLHVCDYTYNESGLVFDVTTFYEPNSQSPNNQQSFTFRQVESKQKIEETYQRLVNYLHMVN